MIHKLAPLDAPFDEDIAAALARYPTIDGSFLSLFRTFANSLRFLRKGVPNLLDGDSPLALKIREIVILRVTAFYDCEYEWGVHATLFADAAKLSANQVSATRSGRSDCWSDAEMRLISAIDQLCATGTLDDVALTTFQGDWTEAEQLEIIALIGAYSTVSLVANTARLPPENFAMRFPDKTND